MSYCVQCGKEHQGMPRCLPCFTIYREAQRKRAQKVIWATHEGGGIRVSHHTFAPFVAQYCRQCGEPIEDRRILYTAQMNDWNAECQTCGDCASERDYGKRAE